MKNKKDIVLKIPTTSELTAELQKVKYQYKYRSILKSTIYTLVIVMAFVSLITTFLFPVFKIQGDSMMPALTEGNIVIGLKSSKYERGDIIAFYYNNCILVKRVIATSSDWVNIDIDGNVYVNDKLLSEPYVMKKMLGSSDIEFPYQVPDNSYFILGDKRENSIDSRKYSIGTVSEEDIVGKIVLKVWPIKEFRLFK